MTDYQPVDISKCCNTAISEIGHDAVVGRHIFRGLPFLIGSGNERSADGKVVVMTGSDAPVIIPIKSRAHRVVMAHSMLESDLSNGGRLGLPVAEYIFHLSDGVEERVLIRERFEIGHISPPGQGPPPGSGSPFRAVTIDKHPLVPRYVGPWDLYGRRQTEAYNMPAKWYYLWAWKNPNHESIIDSLEIVPIGPRFCVGGVTLGHLDEHPFSRQARRPVRIVMTDHDDASQPFDLDVQVDRGDTTYVHTLPATAPDQFIQSTPRGWGEEQNSKASPAYVEISAVPSATITVNRGDKAVGQVKWGALEKAGVVEAPKIRFELIDHEKNWVNVNVVDDETGVPVPCRVHFRSPNGVPFQPHGHHNHVNSNLDTWHVDVGGDVRLGQITYAYIDGTCQGWLPRGEVIVDVARGYEYEPLRTKVEIEPGQKELTLRIKRWIDMKKDGWYSGDSHVHFLSSQGAHTEAQAEDLSVVNLLQAQWGSLFTNIEDFTGEPSLSKQGDSIVYVGQENRQHFLGHMILWGLKKPVMPWSSDGFGEAELGGSMETTLSHWADETHAQGGHVISPHFPNPNGEPAALVATGRLDGVEMIRMTEFNHNQYYRYLNCGYRLPLVGGTDKMSSDVPVGLYRTYANIRDEEFSYESWCKSVVLGRTFLSGGPIIHLSVDGREVGDTIHISGPGTVEVEVWAESIFPLHRLEIVQAGKVIASSNSLKGVRRMAIKERVKIDKHTWLAARCGGPDYFGSSHLDGWQRGVFAHTSPIYVACGGDWWMFDKDVAKDMLTLIEGDLVYIREGSTQHSHRYVTHHHDASNHLEYLERPFHQARAAINKRFQELGYTL